jgi:hypothetical protein
MSVGVASEPEPARVGRVSRKWVIAIAASVVMSLSIKLALALTTVGTCDAISYQTFLGYFESHGALALYTDIPLFIHPPFMIHIMRLWGWLARISGLPFEFWLRIPGILADIGTLWITWKLLQREERYSPRTLVLLALAPASIMISGFHGNTDPVLILFILASIYLIETRQTGWLAGIAFGMSLNTKGVGLILLPVMLFYLPTAGRRVQFSLAAGMTFLIGSMPYIAQAPLTIASKMAGYSSSYGHWGISRMLGRLPDSMLIVEASFANWGKYSVISALIAASLYMNRFEQKPRLFIQCGLVLSLFLSITPGFGIQYLSWLIPFAALGFTSGLLFYASSAVFLFMVYTYWSGGFPWHLADPTIKGDWTGAVVRWEVVCWYATVFVCLTYFYRVWSFFRQREAALR